MAVSCVDGLSALARETYASVADHAAPLIVEEKNARLEVRAMMYGGWGGWGWMMLMPLLWIALIGVIVWAVVWLAQPGRRSSGPFDYGQPGRETPQEILDRRFASGEIDEDAYVQARDRLAGRQPRAS